jgi:hypothetical protein
MIKRLREREPEIRPWLGLVELGCALIMVGLLTLIM